MCSDHPRRTVAISLSLSYLLVILICTPFATATRSIPVTKSAGLLQVQEEAPHREGELLVRFRGGISQRDKETILATHGVKKIKQLRGEFSRSTGG